MRATSEYLTLPDIPVHDPFILAHAESATYYLYTAFDGDRGAVPGHGVLVYRSVDLETWTGPDVVFEVPTDSWADPAASPWAPEVHEYEGRFYLFTTLHDSSTELPPARSGTTLFEPRHVAGAPSYRPIARGSVIAVADSPLGPFTLIDPARPVPPPAFMTLDGTLYVDADGTPWMVYAHEWVQVIDGTFEAVPLTADLRAADGDPIHLFRASEGSWLRELTPSASALTPYVSDGCQLRRLRSGALTMLWSSYTTAEAGADYLQVSATSHSGDLRGPWTQNGVLVDGNAGHGMVFDGFDGRLYLILHRGMNTPRVRAEIHEVVDDGDQFRLAR
jgi:hypothetical protein